MDYCGGEIRHHKDCTFYPNSLTKLYDDLDWRLKESNSGWADTNRKLLAMTQERDKAFEKADQEKRVSLNLYRMIGDVQKERDEARAEREILMRAANAALSEREIEFEQDNARLRDKLALFETLREAAKLSIQRGYGGHAQVLEALSAIDAFEAEERGER